MERGVGIIEKRQEMIGAVFFEEEIVESGIPEFPRVHQQPPDLVLREIEAVFPNISIFDVPILLYLQVVGIRREVSAVPAENAMDRIGYSGVRRYVCRIVNRRGQNSGLFGLALLINTKKRVTKHGCGIVQESRGKDERDRLGLKIIEPAVKPFACHPRQTGIVELQPFPQPVISSDKGALSRLPRAPNKFIGEKLLQRRIEFRLWIGFPIGRHEKSRVVLLTGIAPEKIFSIVEQKMPLSLASELGLQTLADQLNKITIPGRLTSINQ
jgi:hypothetical protein